MSKLRITLGTMRTAALATWACAMVSNGLTAYYGLEATIPGAMYMTHLLTVVAIAMSVACILMRLTTPVYGRHPTAEMMREIGLVAMGGAVCAMIHLINLDAPTAAIKASMLGVLASMIAFAAGVFYTDIRSGRNGGENKEESEAGARHEQQPEDRPIP